MLLLMEVLNEIYNHLVLIFDDDYYYRIGKVMDNYLNLLNKHLFEYLKNLLNFDYQKIHQSKNKRT